MGTEDEDVASARAALAEALAGGASPEEVDDRRADVAVALKRSGQPDAAIHLLREVIASVSGRGGDNEYELLDLRGVLGQMQIAAGRFDEAVSTLEAVVEGRHQLLGAEDPQTMVGRGNLIRALGRGGRADEALVLADALLEDRRRILGDDHPSTLDSRGHRAQLLAAVGRSGEAISELEGLLDDRLRVLGDRHPDVVSTRHNLASIKSRGGHGDPQDATWELEQNAVAIADRLGDDNPETLVAWGMLAEHLQRVGRDTDALALLEKLVADRRRVLGENALPTIISERMRCVSMRRTGDVLRSCGEMGRLLERAEAAFGQDSPVTIALRVECVVGNNAAQDPHLRPEFDVAGAGCDICRAALQESEPGLPSVDCSASFRPNGEDFSAALVTCDECSTVWLRAKYTRTVAAADPAPSDRAVSARPLALLHLEQVAAASGGFSLDLDEMGVGALVTKESHPGDSHTEAPRSLEPTRRGSKREVVRDVDEPSRYSRLTVSYDADGDLLLEGHMMGKGAEDEYEYFRTFRRVDFPILLAALDADPTDDLLGVIVAKWTGPRSKEMERRLDGTGVPVKHWSWW